MADSTTAPGAQVLLDQRLEHTPGATEPTQAMIWDFIIAGGGIAGSVLSTRLAQSNPSLNILLIEAGKNVSQHPLTSAPLDAFSEHYSELDWAYSTVPQVHVNNRNMYAAAGKALSGGSATNYGTWTRGNKADFNYWSQLVGDSSYNYDGWLQYFKKTESYYENTDVKQHGYNGPITAESVSSSDPNRKYPLREPLQTAWTEIGVKGVPDANDGTPIGRAELVEDFKNGRRQLASEAYGLGAYKNVQIVTDTLVKRVLFETKNGKKTAVGVEVANGTQYKASKEVIISTGAYRTPQVLQLSGVGPSALLKKFNIPVVLDAPEVGNNFHDHFSACQWWKTRKPGLALGGPEWTDPAYYKGLPCDWVITQQTPAEKLKAAIKADGGKVEGNHWLASDVAHTETLVVYAPAAAQLVGVDVPADGTFIASCVLNMNPTSRGSIKITSADPSTPPAIDPNYQATNVDRTIMREGMRSVMEVIQNSSVMQEFIEYELAPEGQPQLTKDSTDAEIDARNARVGNTFFHPAGTASMGKVVDTRFKVKGVEGLRVVDASVFPTAITAHYQAIVYALAERAAEYISGKKAC